MLRQDLPRVRKSSGIENVTTSLIPLVSKPLTAHLWRSLHLPRDTNFHTKMFGYQATDYSANVCEIVKVYKDNGSLEATIYYKPNQGKTCSITPLTVKFSRLVLFFIRNSV